MDDRRFDSLVKSLARGASRRSVLKGMLGLSSAAVVGGTALEGGVEAARRPTPTPRPVSCPGVQTWNGSACICPVGLSKCGPDCCNDDEDRVFQDGTNNPNYTECCDNACCQGKCFGEELCCPYTQTWCEATGECCPADQPNCCGCQSDAECQALANLCQVGACVQGQCVFEPLVCDDEDSCTTDSCDLAVGCVHTAIVCPEGQACFDGECIGCTGTDCASIVFGCDGDDACNCFITVEGFGHCHRGQPCAGLQSCSSSSDCPAGWACSLSTCCGVGQGQICIRPCHEDGLEPASLEESGGPTTTGG